MTARSLPVVVAVLARLGHPSPAMGSGNRAMAHGPLLFDLPPVVERAIWFLADGAECDLRIAALARRLNLSPRAVQYGFREHLGVTPTALLRLLRLEFAHRELVAADGARGLGVGDVAAKYHFFNAGRFAALHLATYGELPSRSLAA